VDAYPNALPRTAFVQAFPLRRLVALLQVRSTDRPDDLAIGEVIDVRPSAPLQVRYGLIALVHDAIIKQDDLAARRDQNRAVPLADVHKMTLELSVRLAESNPSRKGQKPSNPQKTPVPHKASFSLTSRSFVWGKPVARSINK